MNLLVPAFLAVAIVGGRAILTDHRAPRPYELGSVAIVYGAAGLLGELDPRLAGAVGWAYLVALLLAPKSADVLGAVAGGLKAAP